MFSAWTENKLKGRHFSSEMKVISAVETSVDGQHSEFFLSGLQILQQRAKKCIEIGVECGEYRVLSLWLVSFLVGLRTYQ
jgi:hypothetical protein